MVKKRKKAKQENNCFYVSRDRLCSSALSVEEEDISSCKLPFTHQYECTYTMVYNTSHLEIKRYDCGCIIYNNKHYYEFKYPETIWVDFFKETIDVGQKNIKFTVRRCYNK